MQRISTLQAAINKFENVNTRFEDAIVLCEIADEEDDPREIEASMEELSEIEKLVESLEFMHLLSSPYDVNDVILSIHPGAGGTESQDWAAMLYRMYTRWAEKNDMKIEIADFLSGEEAGIKSVTLMIYGENAYGYLKSEKGVHRLVRISPFDSLSRRHTSFASVDVIPQIRETDIDIDPTELKIDTYRSGGAGGQHVNKTESAIRITHIPSGIIVQCQNERSQHNNKEVAMAVLRAKLADKQREEKERELSKIRGEQQDIAWGSQIRSYVFQPYTMVKDHRTDEETGDVNSVMDGGIDKFIESYLMQSATKHNKMQG